MLDLRGGATPAGIRLPAAAKPAFPADSLAQTALIIATLLKATTPITPDTLAIRFKQGRKSLPHITATLAALTRLGHLATQDGTAFTYRPQA